MSKIDTTDTDGLYDIYETAGMRISNGHIIYTDPTKVDTDGDGLTDGEEMVTRFDLNNSPILKEIIIKPLFDKIIKNLYFNYKSDPSKADADSDGYNDLSDSRPNEKNEYDMLDTEVDLLSFGKENLCTDSNYNSILDSYKEEPLLFEWVGKGYIIHLAKNEKKVLTLDKTEVKWGDNHENYEQTWQIVWRYSNDKIELILKNQEFSRDDNGKLKLSYIRVDNGKMRITNNINDADCINIKPIDASHWYGYGVIKMIELGIISPAVLYDIFHYSFTTINILGQSIKCAMDNYKRHTNIGLKNSGAIFTEVDGKEVMLYQSGMKKEFKLAKEDMSKCVCEVMGTYNAMILAGYKCDFLKLAVEFEVRGLNDLDFFKPGVFGSDPKKIKYCLNAHNVRYSKYNRCGKLEKNMKKEKSVAIVADNFQFVKIHTFAVLYDKKYTTINEGSNWEQVNYPKKSLEESLELGKINIFFNTSYILKEKII